MDVHAASGRSWFSLVLTIFLSFAACLTAYFLGTFLAEQLVRRESSPVASPPSPIPGLSIEPAELNLGEVWEDPDFTAVVQMRNTSGHDIAVSKFSTSCTCSGVEPPSPVVPAKGSVPLRVKMDLTHRLPYAWGVERRPFSLAITPIVTEGGGASNGWEFTGVVRSRVTLSALRLDFADKCTHDGPVVRRKVRATASLPLAALEAVAEPRKAAIQIEPLAGIAGEYEIAIAPDPKLPLGPFQFKVPLTAVMPDGTRYRCATIQVCGEMQPATRIVPSLVLLGEHPVGGEAAAAVSVRFPGRSGWGVDHIEVESPHLKITPSGTFEDGALRYSLLQRITEHGDQVSKVKFVVRKPDRVQETVEMEVRYYGVALQRQKN